MSRKILLLLLMTLQLTACGRIEIYKYRAFPDDAHAPAVSKLYVTQYVFVQQIDGQGKYSPDHVSDMFPYSGAEIQLLTGKHSLSVKYNRSQGTSRLYSKDTKQLVFDFKPGQDYFLYGKREFVETQYEGVKQLISYHIEACGSQQEQAYNALAKKWASWLHPYVPACGSNS